MQIKETSKIGETKINNKIRNSKRNNTNSACCNNSSANYISSNKY